MLAAKNQNIYTVSRLNAEVRLLLENEMGIVWLIGEISNFSAPVSGHWYLSLKDARAQVKCAMFKGNNRFVTFKPKNGQQVLVKARLSLYEPRGDYQLIIESMQAEGDGRLQQEFEQLKQKLAAEGLFAQSNKKTLPEHPQCVGIITSKTGAALFDILDVLKRRDPTLPVIIYPTMVQGEDAAIRIAQAIGRANERRECDVLIVGRGGGSLEDLWCFNHEIVARTIAASQIPIVSAVGHEIDVTIADFVADVRAPTPSAAAELVSQDSSYKRTGLTNYRTRLNHAIRYYLAAQRQKSQTLQHALEKQHPTYRLERQIQQMDELSIRLQQAMQHYLSRHAQMLERTAYRLKLNSPEKQLQQQHYLLTKYEQRGIDAIERKLLHSRHQLALAAETLEAVSPLSTLKRGYSVTQNQAGHIIRSRNEVQPGEVITTRLADGSIRATVLPSD
ncbi:exodeoxyribonuclease VII large subunit [Vibrio mangrovi]|uniref:Exodeoxyribonuclease 7 large subunit n=1 Tax=Vibrio mangrovi TaxID=474394 RepID=A0A1Y6IVD2_9VIBR|nr:exodeoxyribonuclease VII large subunit [Vibrio mangrovi]MDW6003209.1 exodeoxyribonuclease VII large subunit [Vibrio mangrovi]SMS00003.1 Exodeoxyribonuclease 7 large subunit [Vibrio mangrovi]